MLVQAVASEQQRKFDTAIQSADLSSAAGIYAALDRMLGAAESFQLPVDGRSLAITRQSQGVIEVHTDNPHRDWYENQHTLTAAAVERTELMGPTLAQALMASRLDRHGLLAPASPAERAELLRERPATPDEARASLAGLLQAWLSNPS